MRRRRINSILITVALFALPAFAQEPLAGQKGQAKTDSKMAYHNGPIVCGGAPVFFWGSSVANSQSKPGSGRNGIDVSAIAKQSDN